MARRSGHDRHESHRVEVGDSPPNNRMEQTIKSIVDGKSGRLTTGDIVDCYHIVNPGLVGKATFALKVCFPEHADLYVEECFKITPRQERLYDIRNAINHGDIDAENIIELLRVESRLRRLWMIVWRMFGRFVAFSAPLEREKPGGAT